jgi:hypothetical protein
LVWEAFPSFGTVAASQGSHRIDEKTGNHLAGWGATPYFTEYDSSYVASPPFLSPLSLTLTLSLANRNRGTIVHDVAFGAASSVVQSYRVFKQSWTAYPLTVPSVAVNSTAAYASWNGATEVASWTLLTGSSSSAVTTTGANTTKTGFETTISLSADAPAYLAVAAMSSDGTCLGVSDVYSTSTMETTGTSGTCPTGSTVAAAGTNGTSSASGSSSSSSTSGGAGRSTVGVVGAVAAVVGMAVAMAL